RRLPFALMPGDDEWNLAVHHLAVGRVVVLRLHDPRTHAQSSARKDDRAFARVEPALELFVQGDQSCWAAAHRYQRHHFGARVKSVTRGDPLTHELDNRLHHRLRALARNEEEVFVKFGISTEHRASILERQEGNLASVDPSRAPDDQRARRLTVDSRQVLARDYAALDKIVENTAGADRRKLVGVAYNQDVAVASCAKECV